MEKMSPQCGVACGVFSFWGALKPSFWLKENSMFLTFGLNFLKNTHLCRRKVSNFLSLQLFFFYLFIFDTLLLWKMPFCLHVRCGTHLFRFFFFYFFCRVVFSPPIGSIHLDETIRWSEVTHSTHSSLAYLGSIIKYFNFIQEKKNLHNILFNDMM